MRGPFRLALGAALALAASAAWIKTDERVVFLSPARGAIWIRAGTASALAETSGGTRAVFRTRFEARAAASAVLTLGALRTAEARVDGRPAGSPIGPERRAWKEPVAVELGPLTAGPHALEIEVSDPSGPAALEAFSADPPIASGESWEVRVGSGPWTPARGIDRAWDVPWTGAFPRADAALLSVLPALAPVFLLVFAAAWGWGRIGRRLASLVPSPGALRWILLALWAVLGLNNIRRVPIFVGFDVMAHLRYLQTIALQHRLPGANEGWQTFQAPLYYVLSAPLWNALSSLLGFRLARFWIRLLPLLCGALQVEAAYRCARSVFPERRDLQRLTLIAAGLMPMNLYLSQAAGNEPLAGCLCAAAIAQTLAFRPGPRRLRDLAALGATLGLAFLAKASALVLLAPVLFFLGRRLAGRGRVGAEAAKGLAAVVAAAAAVCGWYYAGNLIRFGTPIANMFAVGSSWWQEPGCRTLAQLTRFGAALAHPVYAGVNGFWDSLYSTLWTDGYLSGIADPNALPPWNYPYMLASGLLALVPTLGIAAGLLRLRAGARGEKDEGLRFAAACVLLYLAAILFVYLRLPVYSAGKASYMLGATPCLALLAASGLDSLSPRRAVRAALYAALACWAVSVYAAYFVVAPVIAVAAG